MDEQTVSEKDLFEPSDIDNQDVEQSEKEEDSAVEETNEERSTSEEQDSNTEPEATADKSAEAQTGDAIDEFIAKKGVDPGDPQAARKIAAMYQNVEKGFYQKSQEKAELERKLANSQPAQSTPDQQALSEVRALKTQMSVEKWKQEKKLDQATEQKMMDWFSQPMIKDGRPILDANGNPMIKGYLYASGVVSLDDVYNFVGGNANAEDGRRQAITEELRDEVKKEMSARQAAKSPKQGSTDSTQFGNPNKEADFFLEGLGF